MGFLSLFVVASMPVLQFLLIGLLGAFLASGFSNILTASAQRDLNKIVFVVFTPAMVFVSLAETVTLQELISWWFMPVNLAIAFMIGGLLGWVVVKLLRLDPHLEGIVIAICSAGNVGNLPLIIVPALCKEPGNPFGAASICHSRSFSYVSLSMALGEIYIWTHSYSLVRKAAASYIKPQNSDKPSELLNSEADDEAYLIKVQGEDHDSDTEALDQSSNEPVDGVVHENVVPLLSSNTLSGYSKSFWEKSKVNLNKFVEELLAPPTIGALLGLIVGVIPWLQSLIIGATAPLRVIQDSLTLLGRGMLPCIPLILGGNLTKGVQKSSVKPLTIIMIIFVRYVILPIVGIFVVKAAGKLGFLPHDPLFHYVLLLEFTVPPATGISTMSQLFDLAKEECSVIYLWTYIAASLALTIWSTVFMWLLF